MVKLIMGKLSRTVKLNSKEVEHINNKYGSFQMFVTAKLNEEKKLENAKVICNSLIKLCGFCKEHTFIDVSKDMITLEIMKANNEYDTMMMSNINKKLLEGLYYV
jgi:hypothetical protein